MCLVACMMTLFYLYEFQFRRDKWAPIRYLTTEWPIAEIFLRRLTINNRNGCLLPQHTITPLQYLRQAQLNQKKTLYRNCFTLWHSSATFNSNPRLYAYICFVDFFCSQNNWVVKCKQIGNIKLHSQFQTLKYKTWVH